MSQNKTSLNTNEQDKKKLTDRLKDLKEKTKTRLTAVEKESDELRGLLKEVKDKNLYLEAYSRRENIKFENIPEDATGKEDTETVLLIHSFMEEIYVSWKRSMFQRNRWRWKTASPSSGKKKGRET